MSSSNPIDLLFGNMEKLGPGSNDDTLKVLSMLPKNNYHLVVDAGCGAGRHTLALAKQIQTQIHAVDSYEPFLMFLNDRAKELGIKNLIQTHCMDMADIPNHFREIDLLWSEGAAYNIGFSHALQIWHSAMKPNGFLVVSELSWLYEEPPTDVKNFFQSAYPDMRSVEQNKILAKDSGYTLLATHTLSKETWIDGYYDILEPRAKALLDHPDQEVRDFAVETIEEIRIFNCSEDSYSYVFYIMRKA